MRNEKQRLLEAEAIIANLTAQQRVLTEERDGLQSDLTVAMQHGGTLEQALRQKDAELESARAQRDQAQREGEQAAELRLGLLAVESEAKRLEGLLSAEHQRLLERADAHAITLGEKDAVMVERNRLVAERDSLIAQVSTLQGQVRSRAEQVRVLEDWQQRAEVRLNELAVEHGWIDCHTFRSEMEAFGLEVRPPKREYEVTVTVPLYVEVTVEAADEDEAREMVSEDLREHVDEQAMLSSVRNGKWDMHEFDITDVNEA